MALTRLRPNTLDVSQHGPGKSWRARLREALAPLIRAGAPRRVDLPESLWGMRRDARGALALHGIPLDALLARWGSPLHVLDVQRLDQNAAAFLAPPPGSSRGCEVYYSYKTNPVPGVLAHLHQRGIGAEVISEYELWLALKLGVAPDKVVFNGPAKSPQSLKLAIERGVLIHLNNREEVVRVAAIAREVKLKARVGLRVATTAGWSGQFGESIESGAALDFFRLAKGFEELDVLALHCHRGGEIATEAALTAFLGQVMKLIEQLSSALGLTLQIVDLGGGLASRTVAQLASSAVALNRMFGTDLLPRPPDEVLTIGSYIAQIVSTVERGCRHANLPRPRIFVEPGRGMTGDTQVLLCRVVNLKADPDGGAHHAVLDAGVNIAEPVKNRYHQLLPIVLEPGRQRRHFTLVGPICTPMDVLYADWELPDLRLGDGLAIMDSGAYFVPFSTSFSFPQPAIVALDGAYERLIRRRETFEDMVRRDVSEP